MPMSFAPKNFDSKGKDSIEDLNTSIGELPIIHLNLLVGEDQDPDHVHPCPLTGKNLSKYGEKLKYWGERVVITDESIRVSQLWGICPGCPPKVYAYVSVSMPAVNPYGTHNLMWDPQSSNEPHLLAEAII